MKRGSTDHLIDQATAYALDLQRFRWQAIRAGQTEVQAEIDEVLRGLGISQEVLDAEERRVLRVQDTQTGKELAATPLKLTALKHRKERTDERGTVLHP